MSNRIRSLWLRILLPMLAVAGLTTLTVSAQAAEAKPEFKVAWSIYVGWMPWDYAEQSGILAKWADKYGIRITLTQVNDYVESINQYTAGQFDACVMTNMDLLTIPAAGGVDSTALIAGDFSNGNDGIVLKGKGRKLADIKGQPVNLVELSVSHYLLARALETLKLRERDVKIVNTSDADIVGGLGGTRHFGRGHLEAATQRDRRPAGCERRVRLEQDAGRDHRPDGREDRRAEDSRLRSARRWSARGTKHWP